VWTLACWLVIIPLGWLTSRRTRLYRYLWRSVRSFDSIQTFVDRLYRAGFSDVEVRTASGWQRGILHTFRARKAASWRS
jgi:ubiquinone/menaquinone biosynthesis C-methylase UbiE